MELALQVQHFVNVKNSVIKKCESQIVNGKMYS